MIERFYYLLPKNYFIFLAVLSAVLFITSYVHYMTLLTCSEKVFSKTDKIAKIIYISLLFIFVMFLLYISF